MKVDSSLSREIFKVLAVVAGLAIIWHLQFVFLILLSAFLLTVILMPFVRVLAKAHLPALLAILIPLSAVAGIVFVVLVYTAPAIREELRDFIADFPTYINQLPLAAQFNITTESIRDVILTRLGNTNDWIFSVGTTAFKAGFGMLSLLVITIYWMSSYDKSRQTLLSYLPADYRRRGEDIWDRVENKLGKWFVGQILVSTTIGLMVWLAASLMGLPFAGTLAAIAFLLEIVPTVGPIASWVPAVLIGMSESFEKAILVTVVYVVIQQIEGNIVTPLLMGRTVRLHPIIIIVAFLIGTVLFGIVGGLLSVPTALVVSSFVDSFRGDKPSSAKRGKKIKPEIRLA